MALIETKNQIYFACVQSKIVAVFSPELYLFNIELNEHRCQAYLVRRGPQN
jgi:hypothetical protein